MGTLWRSVFRLTIILTMGLFGVGASTRRPEICFRGSPVGTIDRRLVDLDESWSEAIGYADYVSELMGLELPHIHMIRDSNDAYASDGVVYLGENLALQLTPIGLAQVIMHEAGHIFEGDADSLLNEVIQALREANLLSQEALERIMHSDEFSADLYAALAAWILEPDAAVPEMALWLIEHYPDSGESHPSGIDRADLMTFFIETLNEADRTLALESTRLSQFERISRQPDADSDPDYRDIPPEGRNEDSEPGEGDGEGGDGGDGGDGGGDGGGGDGGGGDGGGGGGGGE